MTFADTTVYARAWAVEPAMAKHLRIHDPDLFV